MGHKLLVSVEMEQSFLGSLYTGELIHFFFLKGRDGLLQFSAWRHSFDMCYFSHISDWLGVFRFRMIEWNRITATLKDYNRIVIQVDKGKSLIKLKHGQNICY